MKPKFRQDQPGQTSQVHSGARDSADRPGPGDHRSFWKRLASSRMDEIFTRGRQELAKRRDLLAFRLGVRSPAERLLPVPGRLRPQFFFAPDDVPDLAAEIGRRFPDEFKHRIQQAEQICRGEFNLLGYRRIPCGPKMNWQADQVHRKISPRRPWYKIPYLDFDEVGDSKVVWELNRHQHFVTLAMAYRFTGDQRFGREIFEQWFDWQRANPYPLGINWASSLEVAFRSLSWIWMDQLLSGTEVTPPNFHRDLLKALAIHGGHIETYLSTYFSPNTHLLGEAVALFFLGTLCPEIPAAPRWREQGWRIVGREAQRQVRPDGMYFEQSTYYHVYALDFLLHARILAAKNDVFIPPEFDQVLERMLGFLSGISQAGLVPRFGDDDGGRVFDPQRNRAEHLLDPLATGAVLFERSDWPRAVLSLCPETLWLLGSRAIARFEGLAPMPRSAQATHFPDSGLYVIAEEGKDSAQLVIDAGVLGEGNSGHGHADALQLHLSIAGQEWLTDPGTFSYVAGEQTRERFRSTAAHNTLQVDGLSQAVPTSPFAWTSLPRVYADRWIVGPRCAFFEGHHLGYARLAQPVIHRRAVFSAGSGLWLVRDLAEGSGEHQLDLFWHLAPGAYLQQRTDDGFLFRKPDGLGLALLSQASHRWSSEVISGAHSDAYGREEPAPVLHFSIKAALPCGFTTLVFRRDQADDSLGQIIGLVDDPQQGLYSCAYHHAGNTHQWVFADGGIGWQTGELASDARLLYCLFDKNRRLIRFVVCDGSFFNLGVKSLFESTERVSIHEWQDPTAPRR